MNQTINMEETKLAYINKFENLDYEKFKQMAVNPALSPNEKVGFPHDYRYGKESLIWQDISGKLTNLALPNKLILDIGPGCSQLPQLLIAQAAKNNSKIILCDSQEMLGQLPEGSHIEKIEGPFPACWELLGQYAETIDTIIAYSVLHYIFVEGNIWLFLDRCLELLAAGGQLLLGDLPNNSKRNRFFDSAAGIKFHQEYTGSDEMPSKQNNVSTSNMDDSVILSLLMRARSRGFDAYLLPQPDNLPMANRREDILIVRP